MLTLQESKKRFLKDSHVVIDNTLISITAAERKGYLFHGTPNSTPVDILNPVVSTLHNKPVVFAGSAWVGLSFIGKWSDNDFDHGVINQQPYMKAKHNKAYRCFDKGGWLYLVPPLTFKSTTRLTSYEYISERPVIPIHQIWIDKPLEWLKDLGVYLS